MEGGSKMNIQVCIGSSCHVKGSYDVMNALSSLVIENNMEDSVKVQVAFCLGVCKDGVTIKMAEKIITGVSINNVRQVFCTHVLGGEI